MAEPELLAQAAAQTSSITILGLFSLLVMKVAEMVKEWFVDRRERMNDIRRDKYLAEIAKTNEEAAKSLKEVSVNQMLSHAKIEHAIAAAHERHVEVVTAIKSTCKATQVLKTDWHAQPKETK